MKTLEKIALSLSKCKTELGEFKTLLDSKTALSERKDVLPFFKSHKHLAAMVGAYNPKINRFDRIATEFSLFGDYACDLVVGDSVSHNFCFVEFEDGSPTSIFTKKKGKSTPEWSSRFDHGFQPDPRWFLVLEDLEENRAPQNPNSTWMSYNTWACSSIGRRKDLDDAQIERLIWRSEEVCVGSRQVNCITFDDLYDTLALKVQIFG